MTPDDRRGERRRPPGRCSSGSACSACGSRSRPYRDGTVRDAAGLSALLVQASGLAALQRLIADQLLPRASILKARMTLVGLRDVARRLAPRDPAAADRILAPSSGSEASSHEFAELRLAHLALTGALQFALDELSEVEQVTRDGSVATRLGLPPAAPREEIRSVCLAAIDRWRSRAEDPMADPMTADAARTLARTYEGMYLGTLSHALHAIRSRRPATLPTPNAKDERCPMHSGSISAPRTRPRPWGATGSSPLRPSALSRRRSRRSFFCGPTARCSPARPRSGGRWPSPPALRVSSSDGSVIRPR